MKMQILPLRNYRGQSKTNITLKSKSLGERSGPNGPLVTHCILVDFSTVICMTSPVVILGVSGLFCRFYSIFDGKSC